MPETPSTGPARNELIAQFLGDAGWASATRVPLPGDASTRRYERLSLGARTAMLMDAPPLAEEAPCAPGASPADRAGAGYNAQARLAGGRMEPFLAIAEFLKTQGFSAPEIYAADVQNGLALIEDLGNDLYAIYVDRRGEEAALYGNAIDVLAALHETDEVPAASPDYTLLDYDDTALLAEAALLPEWYLPHREIAAPKDWADRLMAAWSTLFSQLSDRSCFVLRDYHAENLLWLPGRQGPARTGVIDFQDALLGHTAYDLVSLLEDARRDVDPALATQMIDRYTESRGFDPAEREQFLNDYAILGAQRNAKILGVFARLVHRDGKPRYMHFMPRVEAHFRQNLAHPALEPVAALIGDPLPEFTA